MSYGLRNYPSKKQKNKTKNCSRLVTTDQGGQKNRNGKTIVVLFLQCFLVVHQGKKM